MAEPRTFWTGYLRLSLVSIDVALYSATNSAGRISLRQIHKPSGKRIRYKKVAEGSDEEADADEIVKGYEAKKGSFVVLEPDDLDQIKLETKDAIRIVQFVDRGEIDPRFYEKPYYVAPRGGSSAEGFVVIREALRRNKKTALGQMVMRGREHLVAIRPCGKGLLLETLRYADEVRKSDSVFDDIDEPDLDDEMMELAESLIEKKSGPFKPEDFEDKYEQALRALIEEKAEGEAIVTSGDGKKPKGGQVIDLMEALKKSVEEEKAGSRRRSKSSGSKSRSGSKSSGSRRSGSKSSTSSRSRGSSKKAG
ncbi:MAG: Ku protein [Oceanicaulis sp.]